MSNFYVVIPARLNSKRFPNKVIANLFGEIMIQKIYKACEKSKAKKVYIATDDKSLSDLCLGFTKNVMLTSSEHRNGTERVFEVAKNLNFVDDDIVINVQCDMPDVSPINIDFLASMVCKTGSICTLYTELSKEQLTDENTVKLALNNDSQVIDFMRKTYKNSSEKFKKHVGMYGYNFSLLKKYMSLNQTNSELSLSLEQMRFHENDYFFNGYEAIIDPGISIDSPEDLDNYIHHNE